MKECKIVQDLLPSYIERLTEEETNKYIESHLKECKECSTVLEKMQKELTVDKEKEQYKKETNYLKKYNKKLNGLRIIISIVILICIFMLVRKMIILMNIQKTAEKYINSNNYYIKSCWYEDEQMRTSETYVKGEQYKNTVHILLDEFNSYSTIYGNGHLYIKRKTPAENEEIKLAILNEKLKDKTEIVNDIKTNNIWELLVINY